MGDKKSLTPTPPFSRNPLCAFKPWLLIYPLHEQWDQMAHCSYRTMVSFLPEIVWEGLGVRFSTSHMVWTHRFVSGASILGVLGLPNDVSIIPSRWAFSVCAGYPRLLDDYIMSFHTQMGFG